MKKITIGILAHVDAGKTTLSESMLYLSGKIRTYGRVDHGDAFLDNYELERKRGITIFSKQAEIGLENTKVTLLDTPGHVDFSAEMERTLQVLDYAVLVISGTDGVQGHTETLMRLLERYRIPAFLFVNKMDLPGCDKELLLTQLRKKFGDVFVDFSENDYMESVAMCGEEVMEQFLETGTVEEEAIADLIAERKLFPCYFGSALRLEGVAELLRGLDTYCLQPHYAQNFAAKVFKIARDEQGKRLTYLKVTGGTLKARQPLVTADGENEKADQLRIYSGAKYVAVDIAQAGDICAVTGLLKTYPGQGLGAEKESELPVLEPVLTYQIILPKEIDVHTALLRLKELEEEEPQLHIVWKEQLQEIHATVMGEIQIEILQSLIKERFGFDVTFGEGSIVYKETIANAVEGVGHYEPLRHYAEVHLLLEPGKPGSGLVFLTECSEDELDGNWQRLILTHLGERIHPGVLAGCPITDMRITLIAGRAHQKHTEGGDFRQATYRAVRQGLRKAQSVLLEPYYKFRIEVPADTVGRVMTDLQKMCGSFDAPFLEGDTSILSGKAPVSTMHDYTRELLAFTKGKGRMVCELSGYEPCHNTEEVLAQMGYDSEADVENPTGSVFCAHGAGFYVNWDEVENYMHLHPEIPIDSAEEETKPQRTEGGENAGRETRQQKDAYALDKELEDIFERTFGPVKRRLNSENDTFGYEKKPQKQEKPYVAKWENKKPEKKYLLVDGYNLLFAGAQFQELAKTNLEAARMKLMDVLCNYQGYKKQELILVFDAYKVKGGAGEVMDYHNIHVVYTKEAQTADAYIEKATHELAKKHDVTVVTSDGLEQLIIMGNGARRISSREFLIEIEQMEQEIRESWLSK